MLNVLIATPALDQKVDAYYTHSLCDSIYLGLENNIRFHPVFLANESILPMARNELFKIAYDMQFDSMVFIDDDEYWDPHALIKIVQSPKDVISLPVVNKSDTELVYNVFFDDISKVEVDSSDGFIKVAKVGTGFLKISKKAVIDLYESNIEIEFRQRKLKQICEYGLKSGAFVGEDIALSFKLTELGYDIWVDPSHTVSHIGNKIYRGNFASTLNPS